MSRARLKRRTAAPPSRPAAPLRIAPRRLGELFIGVGLVAAVLLIYCPCFDHPFINLDDEGYVTRNAHVQAGLTADGVRWAFTTFEKANWHPLTWLSLQLDSTLYGGVKAGGFHLTNVLLHAANALLLFLVLARMTGSLGRSAVVAALFALHPLHVESVAWVAERKDVLSTLFWVLTLAAYLYYVRRPGVGRYLLVVLALVLGLMTKPMLVTLPFVLLLLDYWPLGRLKSEIRNPKSEGNPNDQAQMTQTGEREFRSLGFRFSDFLRISDFGFRVLEKLPLFALALASCAVTVIAQGQSQAVKSFETFPLGVRVANALLAYAGYLGKMVWPLNLAVYYPHPGAAVSVAGALAAGLLLLAITVLALAWGRRRPYLPVGWLWYVGTLVPVIGLVQVGLQAMADRYTYVPSIGVFLMLTWGIADLASAWRVPRLALVGAAAVVLSACVVLTWIQIGYWRSAQSLWEHTLAVTEKNLVAHVNLAECHRQQGHLEAARREYEQAVAIDPDQPHPHTYLANTLLALQRPEEAAAEYRRAVALDPQLYAAHFGLALALAPQGQREEAATELRTALRIDPNAAMAHYVLGDLLRELGRTDEATSEYRAARQLGYEPAAARLAELGAKTP
jgi:tetratricopeptide (TPR) repeat protein